MHATPRCLLIPALAAVLGCGSGSDTSGPAASNPDARPPACVADPAIGQPEDACGVFVSSTLGDHDDPGTREQPVRSMAQALALAEAGPRRIYACAEMFLEPIEVPSGIELWGGLDCANGWTYVGDHRKTTIATEPGAIPLRFVPGDGTAIAADIRAEAASAVEPSGSSIAALVLHDAVVEILRSELVAGDGAAGTPGEKGGGPDAFYRAQDGADGLPGADACTGSVVEGGAAVVTVCDDGNETSGGKGGDGHATYGAPGDDGQPVPPNPDGVHGLGGIGQNFVSPSCMSGMNGHAGQDGEQGLGAAGPGRVTVLGWEGEKGRDGGHGLPGQGGGGGGAVRGPYNGECGLLAHGGASGGSGGAGGCGGKGGQGGGFGGASIGLVTLSGGLALRDVTITTSNGGDGGRGGPLQSGGWGGIGALGGLPYLPAWGTLGACRGGEGTGGGNGGNGGGGLGGPSVGIAFLDELLPVLERMIIHTGNAGKGGQGGSTTVTLPETQGAHGLEGDVLSFPGE